MSNGIGGVDHCVILVRDLDAARARMARLGFCPTPRGVHSEHMGTHNHCIMLRQGYFEVLAVLKPTPANERWRTALERREGLGAIALASEDARGTGAALRAAGVEASEALDFVRPVELPEGAAEARFTVTVIAGEDTPGTSMFVCQHHTREVVWHPGTLDHPNGAVGLAAVTAVAAEPAQFADAYGRIFGAGSIGRDGEGITIDTGATPINIVTPAALAERFPGAVHEPLPKPPYVAALSIAVADVGATVAYLADNDVPHIVLSGARVCVAPEDACGTLFEFV